MGFFNFFHDGKFSWKHVERKCPVICMGNFRGTIFHGEIPNVRLGMSGIIVRGVWIPVQDYQSLHSGYDLSHPG